MKKRLVIGMSGASGAPLTIELLKQLQQYKEIIDQAKEDAVKAKSKIMDEANKQAQEKIEQARHEIESEKLAAQDEMKKEIVDVAVEVATKVMDQNMNTEANKALVDDFVKQVVN